MIFFTLMAIEIIFLLMNAVSTDKIVYFGQEDVPEAKEGNKVVRNVDINE